MITKNSEITPKADGRHVKLAGFVQHYRDLGGLAFIKLRDSTGIAQLVLKKGITPDSEFKKMEEIPRESVIIATGTVRKSKQAGAEVIVEEIINMNPAKTPLAIEFMGKVETDLSKRLDYRWLDLRNPKNLLVFSVSNTIEQSFRQFMLEKGFMEIHTPKLMASPSESGAELFEVTYFKKKAYLAQSPQFYKQMAIASGFERVFEFGQVYRAEESRTVKHTTEFLSFDMEKAWVESEEELMKLEEEIIVNAVNAVEKAHSEKIKELLGREIKTPKTPFPRIKVKEAVEKVAPHLLEADEFSELDSEGEKKLGEYIKQKHDQDFVFLTHFPYAVRPFYHMKREEDPTLTKSYDLLYKGMEITTGAQREHRPDVLRKQAKEKGLTEKGLGKYLEFFEYGCPPHGGWGFGVARFVMQLLGLPNVREANLVPRDPDRLLP